MESLSNITFQGVSAFTTGGSASTEAVMLAKRVDFLSETVVYIGEAQPGTTTASALWRIKRVTLGPGEDVTEQWAGGSASFSQVWDNRFDLSYS